MELFFKYFLTEHPNCELISFGFQSLNILSSSAFFVVAYLLYKKGSGTHWVALLVTLSGVSSFVHHIWPTDITVLFDVIPAAFVGFVSIVLSFKNLGQKDWLLVGALGIVSAAAFLFDDDVCQTIPLGLHFIWHITAATLLYILGTKSQT